MKKLLWFVLIPLASAQLYGGPAEQLEAFIKADRHDMVVKLISERRVDVNAPLRGNLSPLDWALSVGNKATIAFLVEKGAQATGEDLSSYDKGVYVPKTKRPQQIARTVRPKTIRPKNLHSDPFQSLLRTAVLEDDVPKATEYIGAGASIEGTRGQELLRLAVNNNKFQIMTWLMELGITLPSESVAPQAEAKRDSAGPKTSSSSSSPCPPAAPNVIDVEGDLKIASFAFLNTIDADDLLFSTPIVEEIARETSSNVQEVPAIHEKPLYMKIDLRAPYEARYEARLHNTLQALVEIIEGTEARIRRGERMPSDKAVFIRARAKEEVVEKIRTIVQQEPKEAHDLRRKALSTNKMNLISAFREAGVSSDKYSERPRRISARYKRKPRSSAAHTGEETSPKKRETSCG